MPPARSRVADDARSEVSFTTSKDRAISGTVTSKVKKVASTAPNGVASSSKTPILASNAVTARLMASGPAEEQHEAPHVEWSSLPIHALHSYRSAYRLQIPSSYPKPHAELLYKSCDIALRSPSQCLARKKAHDLKLYRKKQLDHSSGRVQTNGIAKSTKTSRTKDLIVKRKEKDNDTDMSNLPSILIEEPPSPTSHPSQQDSSSIPNTADNVSRKSPTISTGTAQLEEEPGEEIVPPSLNQADPISTVIGSVSSTSLATSIRTHFNAQQVNEAETIARFTYVVRQQGSSTTPRTQPLSQRGGILPLPSTTAESIASVAANTRAAALNAAMNATSASTSGTATAVAGSGNAAEKGKANAHTAHSLSVQRVLGGNHIEVEGSYGDGQGWIMGTTSCGRQVRIVDGGGTGTFRLRFRP